MSARRAAAAIFSAVFDIIAAIVGYVAALTHPVVLKARGRSRREKTLRIAPWLASCPASIACASAALSQASAPSTRASGWSMT